MIPRSCHRTEAEAGCRPYHPREAAGNFLCRCLDIAGTSRSKAAGIVRYRCLDIVTDMFRWKVTDIPPYHFRKKEFPAAAEMFRPGAVEIVRPVASDNAHLLLEKIFPESSAGRVFRRASALRFVAETGFRAHLARAVKNCPVRKAAGYFGSEQKFLARLA